MYWDPKTRQAAAVDEMTMNRFEEILAMYAIDKEWAKPKDQGGYEAAQDFTSDFGSE